MPRRKHPYVAWPAFYYGPNGEAQVFTRVEDVPEGWADDPAKLVDNSKAAPEPVKSDISLTREEIISELHARRVLFGRNASTASLYQKLQAVAEEEG